jgi:O-acetyl-ADP-ribose deacetylase (regulator of RNase III)
MRVKVKGRVLELSLGDIAAQQVDAIVNAANQRLAGGGGVDGAIHRAGGPAIMEETRRRYPDGCPTGSAVISGAGKLRAKYVIHAVGPVWNGGKSGEERLLASAYQTALTLAAEHDCRSVALPALSTGAYRYPLDDAARAAVASAASFLKQLAEDSPLELARFVLFSNDVLAVFTRAMEGLPDGEKV